MVAFAKMIEVGHTNTRFEGDSENKPQFGFRRRGGSNAKEAKISERRKEKTKMRKEAKKQQKFFRKSLLIIPHLASTISSTVSTIEGSLLLQTKRSN